MIVIGHLLLVVGLLWLSSAGLQLLLVVSDLGVSGSDVIVESIDLLTQDCKLVLVLSQFS